MEIIQAALKETNLSVEQLSPELQVEVSDWKKMADKYNEAVEEYESLEETDEETEKELDKMEGQLVALEEEIATEIKSLNIPTTTDEKQEVTEKPEKSSSMGWLLFGGVALVVTLGVVNVFKKK
jgi:chromosome segregation ATPase